MRGAVDQGDCERVVRDEKALDRIRRYIDENPVAAALSYGNHGSLTVCHLASAVFHGLPGACQFMHLEGPNDTTATYRISAPKIWCNFNGSALRRILDFCANCRPRRRAQEHGGPYCGSDRKQGMISPPSGTYPGQNPILRNYLRAEETPS